MPGDRCLFNDEFYGCYGEGVCDYYVCELPEGMGNENDTCTDENQFDRDARCNAGLYCRETIVDPAPEPTYTCEFQALTGEICRLDKTET